MEEPLFFGQTNFRNQETKFGIKQNDRRRHMYIIGKTGVGKTGLLSNMAVQDIRQGRGLAIVDPHGEFAENMLNFVPSHRINDVIYFNPSDTDHPIAFNAIEKVDAEHRHLVCSGLVGVFKKIWADSWGPRLEYVLRNAILALLEYPSATLLGIMRILVDKSYRKKIVSKIQDPVVRSFWTDEFAKYPDRFAAEAVSPIQNKVGQFLSSPLIRNIVGQTKSTIDIRKIMDEKKILILNLSKGLIGEDSSGLLGAMMITKIQLAAMSRVDTPEKERNDFYLYVDEFQNFATEAFANILSEARKYRLNLILAHQYIAQLPEVVRDAVFGNVGTLASFRVGAADAEFLEKEFEPYFTADDLVNLPKYNIYLRLMIDGITSKPFSATTLVPFQPSSNADKRKEKIIRVSRERYARRKEEIEDKIKRWSGFKQDDSGEIFEKKDTDKKQNKKMYSVQCDACGNPTEVPFEPDGRRPVYCPDCLEKVRVGEIEPAKPKKQTLSKDKESKKEQIKKTSSKKHDLKAIKKEIMEQRKKNKKEKIKSQIDQDSLRSLIEKSLNDIK